jgi:hypothetical protein
MLMAWRRLCCVVEALVMIRRLVGGGCRLYEALGRGDDALAEAPVAVVAL